MAAAATSTARTTGGNASSPTSAVSTADNDLLPLLDALTLFAEDWSRAQRAQWQSFGAWQQAIFQMNQDMWDAWTCRWAGGIPIDA